jgi:TctA family transporter
MLEKTLRQSLFMMRGDVWAICVRHIAGTLLLLALLSIVLPPVIHLIKRK